MTFNRTMHTLAILMQWDIAFQVMNIIICLSAALVFGIVYSDESNLLDSIRDDVVVSMSSVYGYWLGKRAIDGIHDKDTCARTQNAMISWLQIDLGHMYSLSKIIVRERNRDSDFQHLSGFNLSLANTSMALTTETPVYHNNLQQNGTAVAIILQNILARYVKITRPGILVVCEIEVFEGECETGHFGKECLRRCHCADGRTCNKISGKCQSPICENGFTGEACEKECAFQYFGHACEQKCHCSNFKDCTKDHGLCPGNCASGYEGSHCEKVCRFGRYGDNCANRCGKCQDNVTCHHVTGTCENGCKTGYFGQRCIDAWNLLERESVRFNVSTSSVYANWEPELALDGNTGPDPEHCHCCTSTQNEAQSWYMIELEHQYVLKAVEIFGRLREQSYHQLQGFELILQNSSAEEMDPVYINPDMNGADSVNVTLGNVLANIIVIRRPGKLTLCEVKVYEGACPTGRYGSECRQSCHCADGKMCMKDNGTCVSEHCSAGWKGTACNTACTGGYYGDDCASKCGHCKMNAECHHETGECQNGCLNGFTGSKCKEKKDSSSATLTVVLAIIGIGILIVVAFVVIKCRSRKYEISNKNRENNDEQEDFLKNGRRELLTVLTDTEENKQDGDSRDIAKPSDSYSDV
ncbi:multiple epidermal growth factor-like domains protein 6 isoform X2 [Mercenaria mercenaria]|uniref:multiple epidermal growth factor-like domains protein 6 isoform X2 n=1 Tax=Mercenaria mercenaria TaxID=6596 RepID=UPI00234F37E6|nr:multiple epidermal growth factor-like domains protein 6 isoform X2 [Mercenaria mercenaria]